MSYFMVKTYVAARRPQIWAQAGRGAPEVFIEQSHLPGQEAEVDFGEVMVELAGVACPSARSAMTTCAPRWPRCWAFLARVETDRWVAFRSHYRLEAFHCRPGKQGANEKGGVEGEVGYFRRNHLVPVPRVSSAHALPRPRRPGHVSGRTFGCTGRWLSLRAYGWSCRC
ncbi:hypothetical protein ACFQ0B_55875 [Nonomuraea thailandensis]